MSFSQENALKKVSYYRKSLIDGETISVDMVNDGRSSEILDIELDELRGGILQHEIVEFFKKQAANDSANKKQDLVKIIVQFVFLNQSTITRDKDR